MPLSNTTTRKIDPYERPERYVKTTHGCLRGRRCQTIYCDYYYSFERIPFAKPPTGSLRFLEPVPNEPWIILLDCTNRARKPLQHNFTKNLTEGNEDCLYLNIYVKQFGTEKPLPVMVFLYAGGFERGDPTRTRYGPDYFMGRQIVLVTIAYRLSALGFISFEDPQLHCPGNAGLKDQLLGLKWVKANVSRFNGDPNNITLFGCHAGAASAHFLSMTPLAKGLFHKLILQSGTALSPWALSTVKCMPFRLAKALEYRGPQTEVDIFKFLQRVSGEKLVQVDLLTKEEHMQGHVYNFGPVIEPYRTTNCIIAYRPEIIMGKAWGHRIPMIIGGSSFEGLLLKRRFEENPLWVEGVRRNPHVLLPNILQENYSKDKKSKLAQIIQELYFKGNEIEVCDDLLAFCEFVSYKLLWHPIHRTILSRQWYSQCPTYVYRFDYDSPYYNLYRKHCGEDVRGSTHCDELGYLFYSKDSAKLDVESPEFEIIRRMVAIWTRFAKKSNPNCRKKQNCEWKPVEPIEEKPIYCLNINEELRVMQLPEYEKLKVWNSLYKETFDYDED